MAYQRASEELNRICTDAGVQCTVTMDPYDYKRLFEFKNLSQREVQLTHLKATYVLRPGENMQMKTEGEEPKITKWFVQYRSVFPVNY